MEVQMAAQQAARPAPPPHQPRHRDGKAVPAYLRPPAGSCHHACKYGAAHGEAGERRAAAPPKPRKQPAPDRRSSRVLGKVRSVFRRRAGKVAEEAEAGSVEWKDIVAYDDTVPAHGPPPSPPQHGGDKVVATDGSGDDAVETEDADGKGDNKSRVSKAAGGKTSAQVGDGVVVGGGETGSLVVMAGKNAPDAKDAKPPKGKKTKKKQPAPLLVEKVGADQEFLHGYQALSPSLMQSRASLLRDLQAEMAGAATGAAKEEGAAATTHSLDQEEAEYAAAAAESSRPIPAHRRVKSVGIGRYPLARQASRSSASGTAFKLRSRSTRAPATATTLPPPEEERPARLRSRRGDPQDPQGTGRGIQLRIRSLRRRGVGVGVGGGGSGGAGFVVPAVALRHQKTLEKKRSQRLYNNVIEETASRLAKTKKSRVKALVGAFESVIAKIAK